MNARTSMHHTITQHIIEAMKNAKNTAMPWLHNHGMPCNAHSQHVYQGINILNLWVTANTKNYVSNQWATYKQWQKLGAQVNRGEVGASVMYYQPRIHEVEDAAGKRIHAIMKHSIVFNAQQVDGYKEIVAVKPSPVESVNHADAFVQHTQAKIEHGNAYACYKMKSDVILMPDKSLFIGSKTSTPTQSYYAVLLHELTHWTGHSQRCNRQMNGMLADERYAMEELVAELGAAFLCAELGITPEPRQDHANYLASWISALEDNDRAIFAAARMASEAVGFLHALQPDMEVAA